MPTFTHIHNSSQLWRTMKNKYTPPTPTQQHCNILMKHFSKTRFLTTHTQKRITKKEIKKLKADNTQSPPSISLAGGRDKAVCPHEFQGHLHRPHPQHSSKKKKT